MGHILKFRLPNLYTVIIVTKIKKRFLKKKERVKGFFIFMRMLSFNQVEPNKAGLSVNTLHAGNKSAVIKHFFKNSVGNLLPAIRFLGELYNFCNFVIILYLIKSPSVKERHILQIQKWLNTTKKRNKYYITNYARHTMLKKSFLMVYVGIYHCYENIKTKLWTVSILKPWH